MTSTIPRMAKAGRVRVATSAIRVGPPVAAFLRRLAGSGGRGPTLGRGGLAERAATAVPASGRIVFRAGTVVAQ